MCADIDKQNNKTSKAADARKKEWLKPDAEQDKELIAESNTTMERECC